MSDAGYESARFWRDCAVRQKQAQDDKVRALVRRCAALQGHNKRYRDEAEARRQTVDSLRLKLDRTHEMRARDRQSIQTLSQELRQARDDKQ